jgi:uncharacterized protein (TIGR03792 family)
MIVISTMLAGMPGESQALPMGSGPPGSAAVPSESSHARQQSTVVEHLRLKVPSASRQAWLEAELETWDPWLRSQPGFLGRDLLWDPAHEEGILMIHWSSRDQWDAIPPQEIERVQKRFEQAARRALGSREGHPFPLVHAGELHLLVPRERGAPQAPPLP